MKSVMIKAIVFLSLITICITQATNEEPDVICKADLDCKANEFCNKQNCATEKGICSPKGSAICTMEVDPICGCDGKTYSNPCHALAAGVNWAADGPCKEEDNDNEENKLGAPCSQNDECSDGQFCFRENCDDEEGICIAEGGMCPQVFDPVCGCDGKTYSSRCHAFNEGISVNNKGECDDDDDDDDVVELPGKKKCQFDQDCGAAGEYCDKPACNANEGVCSKKYVSFCSAEFKPVCGCDGKTYTNNCQAKNNGINVASQGACPENAQPRVLETTSETSATEEDDDDDDDVAGPKDKVCGTDRDCGDREFCNKPSCHAKAGICSTKFASFCTMEMKPVCGCDGKTYNNECHAKNAGVNTASMGACPEDSESEEDDDVACTTNADCSAEEFCNRPSCDAEKGICAPKGKFCTMQYDPVCGCDFKTYSNPCFARTAGVVIADKGRCEEEGADDDDDKAPVAIGGAIPPADADGDDDNVPEDVEICSDDDECDSPDEFCKKVSCSSPEGICVKNEGMMCPSVFNPVCACDGKTYSSKCHAWVAGVNVDSEGECPEKESTCSSNSDCKEAEFCSKSACGDKTGVCELKGSGICPQVFKPVCGCDQVTHPSACHALSRGVNVAYHGECKAAGQCYNDEDCASGQRCAKQTCDGAGMCSPKNPSKFCLAVYQPVCGCDGHTYGNSCNAANAGANIAYSGPCRRHVNQKKRRSLKRK